MRARLALDASGQQCELREIALRDKPSQMLQASPKGTVPVLVLPEGGVIDESLQIMLWALGRSDPDHWLGPDAASLSQSLVLIARFDSHFKQLLDRYKYPGRYDGADPLASRAAAYSDLELLESRLICTTHLAGEGVSLADMAIAPFVRQFANVDVAWFSSQPCAAVHRWMTTIVASERFERIMRPISVWVPGTPGARFPPVPGAPFPPPAVASSRP
jgi:glutathione S-transferase